jgi:PST family polysaccharide transporter
MHAAVAVLVPLPLYLWQLRRTGIGPGAVATRAGPAILVASLVGLAAVLVRQAISFDLLALAVAGIIAAAAIGLLLYRTRDALRDLRGVEHA